MSTNFTLALNNTRSSAISTAAGANATIKIYSGANPTNADTAPTGTLLVTLTCAATFGTSTNGVLTLGTVTSGTAVGTGTAGWARIAASGGTVVFDVTNVGVSGADLNLNSTTITIGGTVSVTSGTVSEVYP